MATVKLQVRSEYHHAPRGLHYAAGQIIDVDETLAGWLAADAPGNFTPYSEPQPKGKALDEPPVDKQVKRAPQSKSRKKSA